MIKVNLYDDRLHLTIIECESLVHTSDGSLVIKYLDGKKQTVKKNEYNFYGIWSNLNG